MQDCLIKSRGRRDRAVGYTAQVAAANLRAWWPDASSSPPWQPAVAAALEEVLAAAPPRRTSLLPPPRRRRKAARPATAPARAAASRHRAPRPATALDGGGSTCAEVFSEISGWRENRTSSADWPLPRVIRRVARHRAALARAARRVPGASLRDAVPGLDRGPVAPGPNEYVCP